MHGNAAEWVGDFYGDYPTANGADPSGSTDGPLDGTVRVLRGGGITLSAVETRSAARASFDTSVRLSTFGFRIVRRLVGD